MNQDDYRSILEATDDRQTITIRKHQMAKEIQVNCASLHLANPKTPGRRWDSNKNIHENTGLDTPMLTRYDTIWILRDIMDKEEDTEIAQHSLNMHSLGLTDDDYQKRKGRFESMQAIYSPQFLQAWAQHVRLIAMRSLQVLDIRNHYSS
jgi:DNA replicative helicase MCM subunit Mcm2 (Cdc46/Mcm family)